MNGAAVTLNTVKRRASWERAFNQLPYRCRLQLNAMLGRYSTEIPTLQEIQQIPSEVFNEKRPYFNTTSRRQILDWLKRHGVTSGPIFGRQEEDIERRLEHVLTLLRSLELRATIRGSGPRSARLSRSSRDKRARPHRSLLPYGK